MKVVSHFGSNSLHYNNRYLDYKDNLMLKENQHNPIPKSI